MFTGGHQQSMDVSLRATSFELASLRSSKQNIQKKMEELFLKHQILEVEYVFLMPLLDGASRDIL